MNKDKIIGFDSKKTGERIKTVRKKNKLTQQHLAEKLYVSVDSISDYENGRTVCGQDKIMMMCQMFNVSADYFLFGIDRKLSGVSLDEEIVGLVNGCGGKDKVKLLKMMKVYLED